MRLFITLAICISCSHALLFDVLGELKNLDAFLVKYCRPIAAPVNGKVSCTYSATELMCTGSCNSGFHFDGLPMGTNMALKCSTRSIWSDGDKFPACIGGGGTVINPGQTSGCVDRLEACPSEGNFKSCTSCNQFVTCAPDGVFVTTCPPPTSWDDNLKRCALVSSTCS